MGVTKVIHSSSATSSACFEERLDVGSFDPTMLPRAHEGDRLCIQKLDEAGPTDAEHVCRLLRREEIVLGGDVDGQPILERTQGIPHDVHGVIVEGKRFAIDDDHVFYHMGHVDALDVGGGDLSHAQIVSQNEKIETHGFRARRYALPHIG